MFSKKPGTPATASAGSAMAGGSPFSILGPDTAIRGDISASADIHVEGRVEGDVSCSVLIQGETSEIVGAVTAESARLAGTVRGTISARELVILKSARIEGDVHYDALTIEQGAQVEGRFAPHGAVQPVLDSGESHLILASSQILAN
jgi:cytoskeletal protein CcmA (bactofilin family)